MSRLLIYSTIGHLYPLFPTLFRALYLWSPFRLVHQRMGFLGQRALSWFSAARRGRDTSRLLALPLEVLTAIVQELPWRDVLYIRPICRLLNEVSRSNPVWRSIARAELLEDSMKGANELFFDRSIEQYKMGELESLILRWKRTKQNWTKDDGIVPRIRTIQLASNNVYLVRGGRWLLLSKTHGSIVYLDLDAPGPPVEQILIPELPYITQMKMAISYLPDTDVLTFHLALSIHRYPVTGPPPEPNFIQHIIQVWKIRLIPQDGVGPGDRLSAERLTSFRQEPQFFVHSISILGDYIAHTLHREETGNDMSFVILLRWADLKGASDSYDYIKWVFYLGSGLIKPAIYLLPGHQLLSFDAGLVELHNFLAFPQARILPPQQDLRPMPLWKTKIPKASLDPGPPIFLCPGFTRMVVFSRTGFYGITVPVPDRQAEVASPTTTKLGDFALAPRTSLPGPAYGCGHSALLTQSHLTLVSHSWPNEAAGRYSLIDKVSYHPYKGSDWLLDLMAGRVVMWDLSIRILDLAPTF